MIKDLEHGMTVTPTRDEQSRQGFVGALRAHILGPMAASMRERYESRLVPNFCRDKGREPATGEEVHDLMQADDYFRFYSSVRYNAQEMVFRAVIPAVEHELGTLNERARTLTADGGSTVRIDEGLEVPRNVASIDVHLSPGSYHTEYDDDDVRRAPFTTTRSMSSPSTRWGAMSTTLAGPWRTTCA